MGKKALVISGGGSKGAFAVGVIKQLATSFPEISFDIFVGTSTGSLIAPLAAGGELDVLEKLYTTVTTGDIITKGNVLARLMNDNSLFDAKPLGNLVKQYYDDTRVNNIMQSGKELYLATTCLQTNQAVYFGTHDGPLVTDFQVIKMTTADEFRRAVMASACQPVFMPPIEVQKGKLPIRQYVDGGVREYAGIQLAIDAGADEIYAILLSPGKEIVTDKEFKNAFEILTQAMDIFITDVGENDVKGPAFYNRTLRYLDSVKRKMLAAGVKQADIDNYFNIPLSDPFSGKKALKIHVIRPDGPLGGGPGGLEFTPTEMKAMLVKGSRRINDYMASLPADGSGNV
jgi:NTE family protein